MCNATREECELQIAIGSPPQYDDAVIPPDWEVKLEFEKVVLKPKECVPLKVFVKDFKPVHLDSAIVPLTLLCRQQPIGGNILKFHIDNVSPLPSCDLKVVRRVPPETDNNPGEKAIRITWNDNFNDVLGFPERVDWWRIYNGNSSEFVPGPGNLPKETCIDEDPKTVLYEHYCRYPR